MLTAVRQDREQRETVTSVNKEQSYVITADTAKCNDAVLRCFNHAGYDGAVNQWSDRRNYTNVRSNTILGAGIAQSV